MNQRILFNIASRSRPDKFNSLIKNLTDHCESDNYCILVKVDSNDPCLTKYLDYIQQYRDINIIPVVGESKNKIDAINRGILSGGWDIIVDISDDFVITRKGFDNIIREHCGPDDCLHFPEPYATKQNEKDKNENIIIMAVMGIEYFNRFGYIYNPVYKSLFCDNEITHVAKKLGRYKFVDEDIFYHAHPTAGYGKKDDQTKHTESFWDRDEVIYLERKAKNFGL